MNREPIYAALFGLLSQAANFQTSSRRRKHWDDVSPAQQPSLFQCQIREKGASKYINLPTVYTLQVEVWVYVHSADPDLAPSQLLNPLVDAVAATLQPLPPGAQTLGGLVTSCQISGDIEYDEGLLGDQAVAKIPVALLVPG